MISRSSHANTTSRTIEEVARLPLPGMAMPTRFEFSPDDRLVSYLFSEEGSLVQQLYVYIPQTETHQLLLEPPDGGVREDNISLEEALRRERMRQRELGLTQYAWNGERLLAPLRGDLYISDRPGQPLRKIFTGGDQPAIDAQFSPDGAWIAFVQGAEITIVPATGGAARQLTTGARGTGKTNGLAEYIAQEEMGRRHGFWWSPDSQWLAFIEVDETHIPAYRIMHQGKDSTGKGAQEDHRYPFAGQPNARVRLGIISIDGGEPQWVDLGKDEDIYLARVDWTPDGRLAFQIQNRLQNKLTLAIFDPANGTREDILEETSDIWINLHDMFKPLKGAYQGEEGCFIWASERSGFRHLYLYAGDGTLIRQLTAGEWLVESLVGVDPENRAVFFTATREDPREIHLYAISLEGGEPRRLTEAPGWHTIVLDHSGKRFIDTHQSLNNPPTVTLRATEDGALIAKIFDQRDPRIDALGLEPPEMVVLPNRHGDTLYGAYYRPEAAFGDGPFPTLVWVYGGPHAQLVNHTWLLTAQMRAQYLRDQGFLVFVLDNRGSARRGLAFEGAIKHDMGHLEVEDQVDGVRWLVEQGLADPKRVGIFGWSYGGYMAAMCLARAPETFKAAIAGAPVTNWNGYDTHYTERYMGTPQANPQGYQVSSVMHHVENIRGELMLVHGLIDENVHFRHTARLINALIAERKRYDLLLFPDERHGPRRLQDRVYMEERIRDFFIENL